jgi:hypoxanthine-DNA glycosylase
VTIDATTGRFQGRAWGENIGWVSFSAPYGAATSWRPPNRAPTTNALLATVAEDGTVGITLAGTDPASYSERVAFLLKHRVALWDVLETCIREGSLDARIEPGSERPNDLLAFLREYSGVGAIALNGGKAARLFQSLILPKLGTLGRPLAVLPMPSTSPAHTIPFATKLGAWMAAFATLDA